MENLIKNISNLEIRYLLKELTLEDFKHLKNTDLYVANITKKSKTDIEKYVYTDCKLLMRDIEKTYTTEDLIKVSNRNGVYTLEGYSINEISQDFVDNFYIDNYIKFHSKSKTHICSMHDCNKEISIEKRFCNKCSISVAQGWILNYFQYLYEDWKQIKHRLEHLSTELCNSTNIEDYQKTLDEHKKYIPIKRYNLLKKEKEEFKKYLKEGEQ